MKTSRSPLAAGCSLAIAAALSFASLGLQAQASPYTVDSRLSWESRVLQIRIKLDIHAAGIRLPAGRLEAERMIDRDLPGLAKNAVFALAIDSRRRVSDAVEDGSLDVAELLAIADLSRRSEASFTRDMSGFAASYEIPLDAIGSMLVQHAAPAAFPAAPDWAPSRRFSGIVIYAKGELPVHGEARSGRLMPCLFPRIFDDSMALLLDRGTVDPEVLKTRGELAYASAFDNGGLAIVGDEPLRVMASEIFGTLRTDIVIPREDAKRILALPDNQRLLREGRVLVVLDAPAAPREP
jgi:hypothetical protein